MLIFEHITIAVFLALGVAYCLRTRRPDLRRVDIMTAIVLGTILPDLIDKTAWFVLNLGRSVMHSLVIVLCLIVITVIIFRNNKKYQTLGVMLFLSAILAHQIPDSMWITPEIWFFPLLGDPYGFTQPHVIETLWQMLSKELVLSEFILATISATIVSFVWQIDVRRKSLPVGI